MNFLHHHLVLCQSKSSVAVLALLIVENSSILVPFHQIGQMYYAGKLD